MRPGQVQGWAAETGGVRDVNLRGLRNYQAQIEDALRAELAALQRSLDGALAEQARLETFLDEDTRRYLAEAEAGIEPEQASRRYEGFAGLAAEVRSAQDAVTQAQIECDRKRAEILEAARETQKLDLLLERQTRRERRARLRREQQMLDESAAQRYLRQKDEHKRRNDEQPNAEGKRSPEW